MKSLVLLCCLTLSLTLAMPFSGIYKAPITARKGLSMMFTGQEENPSQRTAKSTEGSPAATFKLCHVLEADQGLTTLPPGRYMLTSPNYPSNYPNSTNISHTFEALPGDSISISCPDVNIEESLDPANSCKYDWFAINGIRHCGSDGITETTAPSVNVQFVSDLTTSKKGFRCDINVLTTSTTDKMPKHQAFVNRRSKPSKKSKAVSFALCQLPSDGERTRLFSGKYVLTSPNHPGKYPKRVNISHDFVADYLHQVSIGCPDVDIEKSSTCEFDWLSIMGIRYCGSEAIDETTSEYHIKILFISDSIAEGRGFRCDITVTADYDEPSTSAPTTALTSDPTTTESSSDCSCGQVNRASRIIGGKETGVNEYPWQARVITVAASNVFSCGGSVINRWYILSAAHCFAHTVIFNVVMLGDHDVNKLDPHEKHYYVSETITHPLHDKRTNFYDFAVVKLSHPISFSRQISPVCLPTPGETYSGVLATASGFGRTDNMGSESDVLRDVVLPVWHPSDCEAYVNSFSVASYNESIQVCAGGVEGEGTCKGDSGGPLVVKNKNGRYVIIGVASFGEVLCALSHSAGVFARVTGVLEWITEVTNGGFYCS